MNDRGVSEAIGFVLVFALVTALIGITYASGFGGLLSAQESEQLANMERAFDVLHDNMESIHRGGATSRATEVKLTGGSIQLEDSISISVKANSTEPVLCNESRELALSPKPLAYAKGNSRVVYSSGAVLRTDNNNSNILTEPSWIVSREIMVIPIITTTRGSFVDTGGDTTVLLVASQNSQRLRCSLDQNDDPKKVTVTIKSPRASAWQRFLANEGFSVTFENSEKITANYTTKTLYVSDSTVELDLET